MNDEDSTRQATRTRLDRLSDALQRLPTTAWSRVRALVRDPARLLFGSLAILLLVLAVPLLVGGATRLDRVWRDWRHETTVDRRWVPTTAAVTGVRENDGLGLELRYLDRDGRSRRASTHVDAPGSAWLRSPVQIRYDPHDTARVDLVGIAELHPLGRALVVGAALGAASAALLLAVSIWRRRRVLTLSNHSISVLRTPLAIAGFLLAVGMVAWAVGTVSMQGWTSIANRIGVQASDVFGNVMSVGVPLVAFAGGCLVTAWLARHRHHEAHDGVLSSAHRIIDRASEYMPSPEQLRVPDESRPQPSSDDSTHAA